MRGRFFIWENDMPSHQTSDEEFLDTFERAGFAPADYGHREHVRTAWLYLQRLDPQAAAAAVGRGIRRLSAAHGAPQRYHETMTQVWVRLVAATWERAPGLAFDALLDRHPELLDRELPYRHYSRERLMSDEARADWVEPDVAPLPSCRTAAGAGRA
jgi:hypothetical protein